MLSLITLIRSVDIPKVGWKKEKKNIIIIPIWRSRLHQLSLTFLMSSTISSSLRLLTRALYPSTMFLSCAMTRIKLFGIPNTFSHSSEDWEFANDLLSVGLKESRPVKLGIFPEIFELKITKYCRIIFFYKALTLKEKDWKNRNKRKSPLWSGQNGLWTQRTLTLVPLHLMNGDNGKDNTTDVSAKNNLSSE